MIVDCFPFFNELDLLEIRLNHMAPYVDRFVITEMSETHSGNPKPLNFPPNADRYKDFPIYYMEVPPLKTLKYKDENGQAWEREHYQREYLMNGLMDCDAEDIILLSDLDEIPDMDNYMMGDEGAFKQKMYYYYLNVFTNTRRWKGTVAIKHKNIETLQDVRNRRNKFPTIVLEGGWHFSTIGNADQIRYKIESFAHTELNRDDYKIEIDENIKQLKDPYRRTPRNWKGYPEYRFTIEMPSGPKWLLENKHRYPHLFYKENNNG